MIFGGVLKLNNSINLKLTTIKFKLDLKELSLFLEAINPKIYYQNSVIPAENIKAYIDFISLVKSKPKLKKINLILPEIEISDNIAIIGSSANLLKTEYGEEINKYDDVIRFNRSPIIGYEKYVGEKTTMRVVNLHVFQGMKPDGRFNIKNQNPKFIKNVKNCKIIPLKHKPHFGEQHQLSCSRLHGVMGESS